MNILEFIEECDKTLPHFADGRINYGTASKAPVINILVAHGGKILLLKRSDKVLAYKGKWNSLGGFLDELKPIEDKIYKELREELSVSPSDILQTVLGPVIEKIDTAIGRTWLIQTGLVLLKEQPKIVLDWEHTDFAWISPGEVAKYDIVPGLDVFVNHFKHLI